MSEGPLVEPNPNATPAAAPAAPEPASTASLPADVIQIPAIQALLAGQPAAVSASLTDFANRPEGQVIAKNAKPLMEAGMGLYRSLSGDLGVLFNRMYIHDEDIMAADKAGKLASVAPSFDEVNASITASGDKHPVLNAKEPVGPASAPTPDLQKPQMAPPAPVKPTPAKVIGPKMTASVPGGPTTGVAPGAGRLLNQILKPVV